jgi:OOP family OmpA-OmpF porin
MNVMRKPLGMGAVLGIALLAIPTTAPADPPPFDSSIDVQTFEYAIGPKTFFTVSDADVADKKQVAVDALVTFLTKPFTVYNYDPQNPGMVGTERTVVVRSMTAAQLTLAYGINERLQLGANLPIIFTLQGDGLMPTTGTASPNGLNVTGLGDLMVELKYRLYKKGALRIGALGGLGLPTSFGSDQSQFIGDDLPTLRGRLALQYDIGRISLGTNAGVLLRKPRTIYDSTIGQQLLWGVAAAFRITDRFSLVAESYGRAGLPDFSLDASPLEVEGGLRLYATGAVAVVLGGGAGLVKGIGSPESRFFLSVGYAPDVRDSDGDGIPNGRDQCPLIPEDKDGWQDNDGCPDDDNDGDRRPDATDKCPDQAEDLDGFDDDDGCPELDNDKDGILDLQDKCPMDPEDGKAPYPKDGCPAEKRDSDGDGFPDSTDACPSEEEDVDGFEDGDGCPELDNDGDGIPDTVDKCPLCPEDKDGFEDADGCPDLDNDHDGVLDGKDACPTEPETINGIKDDDGCPDTGGVTIVKLDGDRLTVDKVPTLDGRNLSRAGALIVDQMALVMIGHDEVTKWLVAVSQPSAADAKRLGDAVKAGLVARGVADARIQILGAGGGSKIGGIVQERGGADAAGFVCPAGKEAKPRPEASLKTPPPEAKQPDAKKPDAKKPDAKKPDAKQAEPEIEIDPDGN